MATPLTDAINALTTYANETTGASDTTLSDAVESLVAGYGGGGGEWTTDGIAGNSEPNGDIVIENAYRIQPYAFIRKPITSVKSLTVNIVMDFAFQACGTLTKIIIPNGYSGGSGTYQENRKLEIADLNGQRIGPNDFVYANVLTTLILRHTGGVSNLVNVSAFTQTPFRGWNSQTGTLYVPSALVESYKTANNWKTLYDAGTMTILPIEGSIYETQYADGTPIT